MKKMMQFAADQYSEQFLNPCKSRNQNVFLNEHYI